MNRRPPPTEPDEPKLDAAQTPAESEQPTGAVWPDSDPTLELLAAEASRRTVAHELWDSRESGTLFRGTEIPGYPGRNVEVPAVDSTLLDQLFDDLAGIDDLAGDLAPFEVEEEAPPSGVIPIFRL